MSEPKSFKRNSWTVLLAPVLVSLVLAACQEPKRLPDYRDAYPLAVSKETVSLSVTAPSGKRGLTSQDALDFDYFVRDYHNRGRRALIINAPAGKRGRSGAEKMRDLLMNAGIPEREISLIGTGSGNAIILSFNAYKVDVPECGNFTTKTTPNWTNRRHANYGCATRRNLGLMVRDPGDLIKAQPMTDAGAGRAAGVVSGLGSGGGSGGEAATAAE